MEAIQHQTATPDSVWIMLQEIGKKQEEVGDSVVINDEHLKVF